MIPSGASELSVFLCFALPPLIGFVPLIILVLAQKNPFVGKPGHDR